ncbi:hypothetical protein BDZ85DRAFT_70360 [Elsinoe ampelina]|uniref:DUF7053 domain-containing protein n=1 Tax=Elsinoe ampelina TaxID=302913 RepID=A0A6A6GJA9_9PEZI|nr:hypothetical protein BDZ85DRAFT_70360 [Elsinoe ampelina]
MFETKFSVTSSTPLGSSIPKEDIIKLLHDFDAVIHTSPDCKGYQLATDQEPVSADSDATQVYDCEDALSFIPRRLWDGGVWYKAIYTKQPMGCDITVKAPAGFTSFNEWRLNVDENGNKSLSIASDAQCSRLFAGTVERATPGNHEKQFARFKEMLQERVASPAGKPGEGQVERP